MEIFDLDQVSTSSFKTLNTRLGYKSVNFQRRNMKMKKLTGAVLGVSTSLALMGQSALASSQLENPSIPSFTASEFAQLEEQFTAKRVMVDGKLYQLTGDMLELVQQGSEQVGIMSAFELSANKWPEGIVYYDFYGDVTAENRLRFLEATRVWEEVADLKFVQRTDQANYIYVRNGSENRSMVGMSGGGQFFSMNNWDEKYIIVHELGHAIGMRHEQQRSDRDQYVMILEENIKPAYIYNFDIRQSHNYSEYDFLSVMHYPSRAYSVNGDATIVPKKGYEQYDGIVGQRFDLGAGDQVGAASHYGAVNINIPDPAFKSYLLAYFDSDNDGEISSLEAAKVEEIQTPGNGEIQSLQGIHLFRYLKHLTAVNENLTEIPELPKRLESLNFAGNYLDAAKFEWVLDKPFLKDVDVTNNLLDVYSCEMLTLINGVIKGGNIQYSPVKGGGTFICDEEAERTLISGKPRVDLRAKGEKLFHIDVPENAQKLTVQTEESGTGGEMNVYVAYNRQPSTTDFDFSSENAGNIENIQIASPEQGRWYVLLSPVERSFEGVDLTATLDLGGEPANELVNQQQIAGLAAATGEALHFTLTVPENASDLKFVMTGGTGDADLYVRFGEKPTESVYDYRPYLGGNEEAVSIANPKAGVWHVMLLGYTDFEDVSLMGSFTESTSEFLLTGETIADLDGKAGEMLTFKVQVPEGAAKLSIATGPSFIGSLGDADLYIKYGEQVSATNADYYSENWSSHESIDVNAPQAGIWYVAVYGYTDFENLWLSVDY
ncbi:pre-peptidase C-terminal domain-containing protein [Microbulbifer sp. THAF38]|uniref:pre-peptidase C-terminal domain-containing protein n=1 Tax=Microbulbifer sp. THAF38 TaxID=2587856 RepID=UPI00126883AB|nr:pre-peptidase C-terminal domain-containing protein [Microbulbifer sp. THAF38]